MVVNNPENRKYNAKSLLLISFLNSAKLKKQIAAEELQSNIPMFESTP